MEYMSVAPLALDALIFLLLMSDTDRHVRSSCVRIINFLPCMHKSHESSFVSVRILYPNEKVSQKESSDSQHASGALSSHSNESFFVCMFF